MKKISYFNEEGLSLTQLAIRAKIVLGFVERDIEDLSEVGYTSELFSKFRQSFNTFWELNPDSIEKSDAIKETSIRDNLHEELKKKMRHIIAMFSNVWPEGNPETLVFEKIVFSSLSFTETLAYAKNLIQFIERNQEVLENHPSLTTSYLDAYRQLLEDSFWSIFRVNAQNPVRSSNTQLRHLVAQELYRQIQTATMFGKIAFMYEDISKYNDYIINSSGSFDTTPEEDVGEILELEAQASSVEEETFSLV